MNRDRIIKSVTTMFIVFNILILITGYGVINDLFKTKDNLKSETNYYLKKEEDILAKLDIIKQSNIDIYSNIKNLRDKTILLENQVEEANTGVESTQEETQVLKNKILSANEENTLLQYEIKTIENQIAQQKIASTTIVRRTTRSS